MAELKLLTNLDFTTTECCRCGVQFALPAGMLTNLRNSKGGFYCPNGHSLSFQGETEAEKLQKRLAFEQQRREAAERDRDAAQSAAAVARGKLKAQSARVKHGVCPCCKRTVSQMARHMKSKHPTWDPAACS